MITDQRGENYNNCLFLKCD